MCVEEFGDETDAADDATDDADDTADPDADADADDDDATDDADDAGFLAQLHDALRRQTTAPAAVVEAGRAVFALRDLDAELALLVWDSELDEAAVTVRGAPAPGQARAMTFEHPGLTVELEAEPDATGTVTLLGQLVRPDADGAAPTDALVHAVTELLLERDDAEPLRLEVDDLGRFLAERVGPGRARVRVRRPARPDVLTSWFALDPPFLAG